MKKNQNYEKVRREELRGRIVKEYREKLDRKDLECKRLKKENAALSEANVRLESEVRQLKEWNERLLEFMDMSQEELVQLMKKEKMENSMLELATQISVNMLHRIKL